MLVIHYQSFGNNYKGDCEYAAAANLTLHEYPLIKITTKEVLKAWNNGIGETYYSALKYVNTIGWSGHKALTIPVITRPSIIYAANHGGVWATEYSGTHAIAIIAANKNGIRVVDSTMNGITFYSSWNNWAKYFAGKNEEYWWFKWKGN